MSNDTDLKKYLLILIVFVGVIGAYSLLQKTSNESDVTETLNQIINSLCANFPQEQNEYSCQQAIDTALMNYPDSEIVSVDRTEFQIPSEQEVRDAWLVDLSLNRALNTTKGEINNVQVVVDRTTGAMVMVKMIK